MQHATTGGSGAVWAWISAASMGQTEGGPSVGAAPAPAPSTAKQVVPAGTPGATSGPAGTVTPGTPPAGPAPGGSMITMMLPIILVFVVMILLTSMTGRKERKRRAELLNSIKKHDKVQTAGGVIGTITDIDGDEIVLRLEEGRMRVSRNAIQTVLREAKGPKANGVIEEKDRRAERVEA